jgi:hypothetical protein
MKLPYLAILFLVFGLLLTVELYLVWDGFQLGDIHHETWIITFTSVALVLIVWANTRRKPKGIKIRR